ncbi:16867_t:CDS:2 [Funneliformis caledonium]|uniref:16867_t:CDS:1 n=1 Tax=Funneliformis caledonium TaxID=1117310 RepID=A0A9N9DNL5_9GLOM|nr:16867_t:CDS:2 [Funneliformis caledonium]
MSMQYQMAALNYVNPRYRRQRTITAGRTTPRRLNADVDDGDEAEVED